MTIEHSTIGTVERRSQAARTVKIVATKEHLDTWIVTPGTLLLNAALFGACFGILSFLTVLGVRLALRF